MHEYWHAYSHLQPQPAPLSAFLGLVTTVAFGLSAVLQNLYLLRLG